MPYYNMITKLKNKGKNNRDGRGETTEIDQGISAERLRMLQTPA